MRTLLLMGAVSAAVMTAGAASAATKLEIKDAVVRVVVIPENRADVKVETVKRNGALPMDMKVDGDTVKIDGGLKRNAIRGCNSHNGRITVEVRGGKTIAYDDMPQIIVHAPMNVDVETAGAVFGEIRGGNDVNLANAGCGDWKLADASGKVAISQAGSGDTQAGGAASLRVRIAGSGDVAAGAVRGDVSVEIAGSGDTHVSSLNGALSAKIAGSGDVTVDGGRATALSASIDGSGDVNFRGVAGAVSAKIAGSGDVNVQRVEGPVARQVIGSGEVHIG